MSSGLAGCRASLRSTWGADGSGSAAGAVPGASATATSEAGTLAASGASAGTSAALDQESCVLSNTFPYSSQNH